MIICTLLQYTKSYFVEHNFHNHKRTAYLAQLEFFYYLWDGEETYGNFSTTQPINKLVLDADVQPFNLIGVDYMLAAL